MAAKVLLPGFGGAYTTETFTDASSTGADTLDCMNMDELAIQITADGSAAGTVDIEHTFDMTNWTPMVDDLPCATANDKETFELHAEDGPFGVIRFNATDITAGTASFKVVGKKRVLT